MGNTLIDHVARVRDVELVTGFTFMTSWSRGNDDERQGRMNKVLDLPQFDADWFTMTKYTKVNGDVTTRGSLWSFGRRGGGCIARLGNTCDVIILFLISYLLFHTFF